MSLSCREGSDVLIQQLAKSKRFQDPFCLPLVFLRKREENVLHHGEIVEDQRILWAVGDIVFLVFAIVLAVDFLSIHQQFSIVVEVVSGKHGKECRFAGTIWSCHKDDSTAVQGKARILQDDMVAKRFLSNRELNVHNLGRELVKSIGLRIVVINLIVLFPLLLLF